jgi:hypothetical protein
MMTTRIDVRKVVGAETEAFWNNSGLLPFPVSSGSFGLLEVCP